MKRTHTLLVLSLTAVSAVNAASLKNLFSFTEETKIKGGFLEVGGQLYFTCEKGGAKNFGYIGRFNPADGNLVPQYSFVTDAKPKGGLVRVGNDLFFQCEKGAATTTWGWIGRFNLATGSVTEEFAYTADAKPKSGLIYAGGAFYYATEKGGYANWGAIEKLTPGAGVATLSSLTLADGIKIESWAADPDTGLVYYGAREGGDITQLTGKGAGAIGRIDMGGGTVSKLVDLDFQNHGAKIRSLTFHAGKLWFVLEEGGDLSLENGKGGGAIANFDLATRTLTRLHVFSNATGFKPKGLVRAGNDFYVATEKGGAGGLGVLGVLRGGMSFESLAEFDATVGAKPDNYLRVAGQRIYLALELGTPGYLGGISAYELAAPMSSVPSLKISRLKEKLHVSWPAAATGYVLQATSKLGSTEWWPVARPPLREEDQHVVEIELDGPAKFFRLQQ
ncbi:MAG: hypothetical protein HY735_34420 [Verrucomicrobia bacterium]|nr:hypothetical protein [Verrucomicrobiota bacterium]